MVFSVSLMEGCVLVPNYYSIRHGLSGGDGRLRSWVLEGSNGGCAESGLLTTSWVVLRVHKNDDALPDKAFSVASWEVEGAVTAYRHFRIRMTGANSSGDWRLLCAGIELYGYLHTKKHSSMW